MARTRSGVWADQPHSCVRLHPDNVKHLFKLAQRYGRKNTKTVINHQGEDSSMHPSPNPGMLTFIEHKF